VPGEVAVVIAGVVVITVIGGVAAIDAGEVALRILPAFI